MLIIGPLVLMLIMGFSFAGAGLHDVTIGIYDKNMDASSILGNISYARLIYYNDLNACKRGVKYELDACVDIKREFKTKNIPRIDVIIYFDNSKKISTYLIPAIKNRISASSKGITIGAVDSAADKFQNARDYLTSSKSQLTRFENDIDSFISNLVKIKNDIDVYRRKFLSAISSSTRKMKSAIGQAQGAYEFSDSLYNTIDRQLDVIETRTDDIHNAAFAALSIIDHNENKTNLRNNLQNLDSYATDIKNSITAAKENIKNLRNLQTGMKNDIDDVKGEIDKLQINIEDLKKKLDDDYTELDRIIKNLESIRSEIRIPAIDIWF